MNSLLVSHDSWNFQSYLMFLFSSLVNKLFVLYSKHSEKYKKIMIFLKNWICIFLLVFYFSNMLSAWSLYLIYTEILAHMNSHIMWFVSILVFFLSFHYYSCFMKYIWLCNLFWQFFFLFICQNLKFLKN
jgi:hypothetical protein